MIQRLSFCSLLRCGAGLSIDSTELFTKRDRNNEYIYTKIKHVGYFNIILLKAFISVNIFNALNTLN